MSIQTITGHYLNPENPRQVLWLQNGQAFVIYEETDGFFFNKDQTALSELDWDAEQLLNKDSAERPFLNIPKSTGSILSLDIYNQLKSSGQVHKYTELTKLDRERLKYKILNYYYGSPLNPISSIYPGTDSYLYFDKQIPLLPKPKTFSQTISDLLSYENNKKLYIGAGIIAVLIFGWKILDVIDND